MKKALLQQAGMLIFWEVINWTTIDHYGHLGGLLSGLAIAVILAWPSAPGDEPSTPPNLRRRALLCGVALAVGMLCCIVKIFFWGSQKVYPHSGTDGKIHDFPWKDICQADVSGMYSRTE